MYLCRIKNHIHTSIRNVASSLCCGFGSEKTEDGVTNLVRVVRVQRLGDFEVDVPVSVFLRNFSLLEVEVVDTGTGQSSTNKGEGDDRLLHFDFDSVDMSLC